MATVAADHGILVGHALWLLSSFKAFPGQIFTHLPHPIMLRIERGRGSFLGGEA